MIICKTGPGYEYSQDLWATCSPGKWMSTKISEVPDGIGDGGPFALYYKANFDFDNVTWQRKGQEIMILPPYEFCPEVYTYCKFLLVK